MNWILMLFIIIYNFLITVKYLKLNDRNNRKNIELVLYKYKNKVLEEKIEMFELALAQFTTFEDNEKEQEKHFSEASNGKETVLYMYRNLKRNLTAEHVTTHTTTRTGQTKQLEDKRKKNTLFRKTGLFNQTASK